MRERGSLENSLKDNKTNKATSRWWFRNRVAALPPSRLAVPGGGGWALSREKHRGSTTDSDSTRRLPGWGNFHAPCRQACSWWGRASATPGIVCCEARWSTITLAHSVPRYQDSKLSSDKEVPLEKLMLLVDPHYPSDTIDAVRASSGQRS